MTVPARHTIASLQQSHHRRAWTGRRLVSYVTIILGVGSLYLVMTSRISLPSHHQNQVTSGQKFSTDSISPLRASKTSQRLQGATLLPLWTGWKTDGEPKEYGLVTLTGSYRFPLTDLSSKESSDAILHFPMLDLKNHIEMDEADSAMIRLISDGALAESDIPLAPPVLTKGFESPSDYALLTRCGFKTAASATTTMNQDRSFLLQLSGNDFIMALLDGHGERGHVASHFAALELPKRLPSRLMGQSMTVEKAITDTFLEVERDLPSHVGQGGTTAIVLYRRNEKLYIANTGDSLAIVVSYDPSTQRVEVIFQTTPHKPHLPEERKRIESLGGKVLLASEMSEHDTTSRVLIPADDGINFMALAMSRSLGDVGASSLGVIVNPTVDTLDLQIWRGKNLFAIAASDGLWDHVAPVDVAQHVARSLYKKDGSIVSPLEACEQLIMQSSKRWIADGSPYRDDITIAVRKLF